MSTFPLWRETVRNLHHEDDNSDFLLLLRGLLMDYSHNYFLVLLSTYREFKSVQHTRAHTRMRIQIITMFYGCQLFKTVNNDINHLKPAE